MKKRFLAIIFISALIFLTASCGDEEPFKPSRDPVVIQAGDLSIHFLELGNKFVGDCIYINYNDIDIVIDAGSRQSSATTIIAYINDYIQDDTIEYVIATHGHQDHIAGFYSTRTVTGILDYYKIGTIIDFPRTNSTTATYNNYRDTRDRLVSSGETVHYTALQCYREEDGAKRIYELGGDVKLEILYNYYYENYSSNENNYSVAIKILQGEKQYIFTGDMEKIAEDEMVKYYEENYGGLGPCVLYKGGHHGSFTSSNENLMMAITPEYICVCTCTGTDEYSAVEANKFPSQAFINRVAPYTDKVYMTTLITDYANNKYESFNGNIVFLVSEGDISINCSNHDLKLKDTEWFKLNRAMPNAWM